MISVLIYSRHKGQLIASDDRLFLPSHPSGGQGCLMSGISGISFGSHFLSRELIFFSLCLVLFLFLSCHCSANGPFSRLFPPKYSPKYFDEKYTFCFVWLLLSSSDTIKGKCCVQPASIWHWCLPLIVFFIVINC